MGYEKLIQKLDQRFGSTIRERRSRQEKLGGDLQAGGEQGDQSQAAGQGTGGDLASDRKDDRVPEDEYSATATSLE